MNTFLGVLLLFFFNSSIGFANISNNDMLLKKTDTIIDNESTGEIKEEEFNYDIPWKIVYKNVIKDFNKDIEKSNNILGKELDIIMDGMLGKIDIYIEKIGENIDDIGSKLPEKIILILDIKLEDFFNKLYEKTSGIDEYIKKINILINKIDDLNKSGKSESILLKNALNYIAVKAKINKNEVVLNSILDEKYKDVSEISKEDLELLRGLYDLLELK